MCCATRNIIEVEEFCLKFFMMTINMKGYIKKDNDEELGKLFRGTLEGHIEHDLYTELFSNQLESDEMDTLQQRIE